MYLARLGRHPERLANLYLAFLFVARAVAKAAPVLAALDLAGGGAGEAAATRARLAALLEREEALGIEAALAAAQTPLERQAAMREQAKRIAWAYVRQFAGGNAIAGVSGDSCTGYLSGNGLLVAYTSGYLIGRAIASEL
jgi:hypothetical protein